jgi:iron only hydrogenase large subunit-like protein
MKSVAPIYTERSECQDCYKCLRACPVKAIKVQDGCAIVMGDNCIYCGHCVQVCPNGAKHVRNDLEVARHVLRQGHRAIVSLAPSFVCEFAAVSPQQLIAALRKLGFDGVSETALGAQQVTLHVSLEMQKRSKEVYFSSACPAVVEYVRKYHPEEASRMASLLSPVLTHCKMLRKHFGDDTQIVFIGPCIAKKREADARPDLLAAALTYEELRQWFQEEGIIPETLTPGAEDRFTPEDARDGALYPIEGGMSSAVRVQSPTDGRFMSFSGLSAIREAVAEIGDWHPQESIFLELLACQGGCINGPKTRRAEGTVRKRYQVIRYAKPTVVEERVTVAIDEPLEAPVPLRPIFTEAQIRGALRTVGKFSAADERNCGGCGYDSCRELACALLEQKAERTMCATYMRQLAQKKANTLISKMPSAVVIVNEKLQIVECNQRFRAMFDEEFETARSVYPDEEPPLTAIVPFHYLFQRVLEGGEDVLDRDIRFRSAILHASIFTIEPNVLAGAVLQDITRTTMQKEQIITRAQQVIYKNLKTVQQIAFLLGENATESEITLNSIVESFSTKDVGDADKH